jgi:hypothetical protein
MTDSIESSHFVTVVVGDSKIRFAAVGRTWDERDHDLFAVQLPGRPLLYGEWRPKFAKNGDDFDVEIVFFGLIDGRDAGIPLPARRVTVSRAERLVVEKLVLSLFSSVDAKARIFPFSSKRGKFLGQIDFLPDWIR